MAIIFSEWFGLSGKVFLKLSDGFLSLSFILRGDPLCLLNLFLKLIVLG